MKSKAQDQMDSDDEDEEAEPLIDTNLFKEHIRAKIINIFQNVKYTRFFIIF